MTETAPDQQPETEQQPEKRKRTKRRGGLFVTDAEIVEKLGVPDKIVYEAIHGLDNDSRSRFPPKIKLWGKRHYWPAVQQWFDDRYLLKSRNRDNR